MEQTRITLSQIGLYNPQRLSDEVTELIFIARLKEFAFIMTKLKSEKAKSIPQHHLIIAQRGMGKTSMLKRIEVELRKTEFNKKFIPVLLPEEQYNVNALSTFWLNVLDALANSLEQNNLSDEVKTLDEKIKGFSTSVYSDNLSREIFQYILETTTRLKTRPVLLVDNMSMIFDRLSKADQHELRAQLMKNNAPILIGASALPIDQTTDYGAPFYDAFQMHYFSKLKFEELIDILNNLARLTHSEEALPVILQSIGRLKTIHQLTGGNPRTATMLFKMIVKGFAKEINDDLEALLDEITPLYKARFEELGVQMQTIVDAIALHWDPMNLEQMRIETRLENNQLSPQLNRLIETGWIEKLNAYKAKGGAYQITERFFNIWFLMRRSSRRQKKELYCLSKFLESFYGDDLENIAQQRLSERSNSLDHISYDLALSEVVKDKRLSIQLQERGLTVLNSLAKLDSTIYHRFGIKPEINKPSKETSIEKEEILLLEKIIEDPQSAAHYFELAYFHATRSFKYLEAEKAYLKSIELDHENFRAYNNLGILYQDRFQRYADAEKAHLKAIEVNPKYSLAYANLGFIYQSNLQRYEDAEKAYLKSIELDPTFSQAYSNLGYLYQTRFQRYSDAEKAYLKAIEVDPKNFSFYIDLGILYQFHLERFEEAQKEYLKAIELSPKHFRAYIMLGTIYQQQFQRYEDAENAYLKAKELDPKNSFVYNVLGNLYQDNMKRPIDAEKVYLEGIAVQSDNDYLKYNLVFLYRDQLNKTEEAVKWFSQIERQQNLEDTYYLNTSLFELYKKNEGLASEQFLLAAATIKDKLPNNTQDDWWRFAAVATKLGYGTWLLELLEKKELNVVLAPFYIAVKAINEKDTEGYLLSKAVELREPARKIMALIQKMM